MVKYLQLTGQVGCLLSEPLLDPIPSVSLASGCIGSRA